MVAVDTFILFQLKSRFLTLPLLNFNGTRPLASLPTENAMGIDVGFWGSSAKLMLASLIIGVGYGLATGIGYIGGFSSGGTDTLARVLKFKVFNYLRVGDIQMVMDVIIILVSAFVFNMNVALYAVVTAVVSAKIISMVMTGFSGKYVQFDIITSHNDMTDVISEYIMNEVHRAVTSHVNRGEYSHEERRTLTVICTPAESVKIKKFVADTDPDAFATIMPITSVWGKRFSDIREVDNV